MSDHCNELKIERFGRSGWFFMTCEEIPGISLFGPDLEALTASAEIAIAELLKSRGEKIVRVSIEAMPADTERRWSVPNTHIAFAHAA